MTSKHICGAVSSSVAIKCLQWFCSENFYSLGFKVMRHYFGVILYEVLGLTLLVTQSGIL